MAEENTTFDEILEEVKSEAKKEKAKKTALLKTHPTNATLSLVDGNICIHIDDAHYVNGGYDIISEELNDIVLYLFISLKSLFFTSSSASSS